MSVFLSQIEADGLLAMHKHYMGTNSFDYPDMGGSLRLPLHSADQREEFSLDITRGRILLEKNTFQNRARKAIVLARLDLGGPPHWNPDGEELPCPHLHIYREGFGTKWAIPIPPQFTAIEGTMGLLYEFMNYCNIVTKPSIRGGLFS